MLIYNFQKEFIGIDEKDLKTLGFNDLSSLRAEVSDFADLFVKTPGYIHNFKHVHWIDFIACADSHEESKVIINVNNKSFKCIVNIQTAFLTDNPSAKAYIVHLNNLRELTHNENEHIAGDIIERPLPKVEGVSPISLHEAFHEVKTEEVAPVAVQHDPYETPIDINFDDEDDEIFVEDMEPDIASKETVEVPEKEQISDTTQMDDLLDVGDLSFDEEDESQTYESTKTVAIVKENFDNGYVYDPHVASDELGLPIDLIEEFIQDFILQAKEFKEGLYTSLNNAELDNVKTLSHKLKGVAANLRVEDAFETLSTINTSSNIDVIKENLDIFYKIIAKLAGEEIEIEKIVEEEIIAPTSNAVDEEETLESQEEEYEDDLYSIDDTEVPQKIDIPELADDDFISSDIEGAEVAQELDDIEGIELLELDKKVDEGEEVVSDLEFKEESTPVEYSKNIAASEIGLDQESFNELLVDYFEEAEMLVIDMKRSLVENDFSTIKNEAIKLKGMSDNMRINSFTSELETLMDSTNSDEIANAIERINAVLAEISKIED